MGHWKAIVKELNIAPSEAWSLDVVEIYTLFDKKIESPQDLSFAVNAQRKANGMPEELLKNRVKNV